LRRTEDTSPDRPQPMEGAVFMGMLESKEDVLVKFIRRTRVVQFTTKEKNDAWYLADKGKREALLVAHLVGGNEAFPFDGCG
jgi:hypothetical protein